MKTNYRPRSNTPYRKRTLLALLLLAVFGLGAIILRRPLQLAGGPIWQGRAALFEGWGNFKAVFSSKETLQNENAALKEQLASYDNLILSCRAVISSRDDLLSAFGRSASSTRVASSVLVHPPETIYDLLVLDAGEREGIKIGDTVRLPQGGAIGRVSEVAAHTSKATLYTSDGVKTEAILERNQIPLTLTGRGGGNFEASLPRDVAIMAGDKILSPEIRSEMIGIVGDVSAAATDSFQHILIRSPENMYTLRFVIITS